MRNRQPKRCHCEERNDEAISYSLHNTKIATLPRQGGVARNDERAFLQEFSY
jgi:hypothetical protein